MSRLFAFCFMKTIQFFLFIADASDIGVWTQLYSGTLTYYSDRNIEKLVTYSYRVTCLNAFSQVISEPSSPAISWGGVPQLAGSLSVVAVTHQSIRANWTTPSNSEFYF